MRVLVACEFSGIVRDAFRAKGHDAYSCDLMKNPSPYHITGDALAQLERNWDLLIAHPPCTYLANSGVRWLFLHGEHRDSTRWNEMVQGALFFKAFLEASVPKIAIENPVIHKYALHLIGRKHDQVVQPWQFGHGETKATCLWLKGLPKLKPTNIVEGRTARVHQAAKTDDRQMWRSMTMPGLAEAMAEQWS